MKVPDQYPVTQERWERFLKDGDDAIFHKTVVSSCRGQFKIVPCRDGGVMAECQNCHNGFFQYGSWMSDQLYAITPEREPRYKLVEVTAGKTRYTTLVLQT